MKCNPTVMIVHKILKNLIVVGESPLSTLCYNADVSYCNGRNIIILLKDAGIVDMEEIKRDDGSVITRIVRCNDDSVKMCDLLYRMVVVLEHRRANEDKKR